MTQIPQAAPAGFRVTHLNRFAQGGRWRTEAMRSYRQPVLIWFTRGQGRITVSGVTRGYGPHNLVFLPAGTMHGFDTPGQVFGSVVFLPPDPALMLPDQALHLRFRDSTQQNELTGLIDALAREIEGNLPARERALHYRAGLVAVWIERQIAQMPEITTPPDASRRLAAAYSALIEQDLTSGRSVAEYAAVLGVSPTHLSRACNIASGRPASALLADRILFEARRLLSETRLPVGDIAAALGFTSAAYFTRSFHRQTGLTPTQFRAQT